MHNNKSFILIIKSCVKIEYGSVIVGEVSLPRVSYIDLNE